MILIPRRILTQEEVSRLIRAAQDSTRDHMLLKCLYFLALKSREAAGMSGNNTHLEEDFVHAAGRRIPIPEGFGKELSAFVTGKDMVFEGRHDGRLSDRHIRRIVKTYAVKAGLKNPEQVKPHTLRSSYAGHLADAGFPVPFIQQVLGHAKAQTTALYTSHSISRMNEWLREKGLDS